MAPFVLSLHKASLAERFCLGLLYGCLYSLPSQWMAIWVPVTNKHWSFTFSCLLMALFFSCYVIPIVIFSLVKPFLTSKSVFSVLNQGVFFTCAIAWFPTYFSVTPACMIHDQPLFYQTADFGGLTFVIFTVLFVNISIAEIISNYKDRRFMLQQMIILIAFLVFVVAYGYYRIEQFEHQKEINDGESIEVIAVQTKIQPKEGIKSLVRQNTHQKYSAFEWAAYAIKNNPKANLIVFPESPIDLTQTASRYEYLKKLSEFAKKHEKTLYFNYAEQIEGASPPKYYNTSQLMMPDGKLGEKYRKIILTPVYENNPVENIFPIGTFYYKPGVEETVIQFNGANLIPAVCYEAHSPGFIRNRVLKGGDIIIHTGNFQAFGTDVIACFDLAMVKLRAVEHRVPIVRSCNMGYGAFIEADGKIVHGSLNPPAQRNAESFSLFIPSRRAPYTAIGNLCLYSFTTFSLIKLWSVIREVFQKSAPD
ncbi:MAG: apolipoprotein N-acyltransferase [bacterium]|nr:apolipoprotein N-acyltransferase [bacterium]